MPAAATKGGGEGPHLAEELKGVLHAVRRLVLEHLLVVVGERRDEDDARDLRKRPSERRKTAGERGTRGRASLKQLTHLRRSLRWPPTSYIS